MKPNTLPAPRNSKRILGAGAALILLFVTGYYTYIHVGESLFAQTHSSATLPPTLLLSLALVGGAASFFSPCSLAITPSFLIYFIESGPGVDSGSAANRRRFLSGSAVVALGIIAFYALAGALVSWIGAIVYNVLIYLIPLVGIAFLGLGILILFGRGHALGWLGRFNPVQPYYDGLVDRPAPRNGPALFGFGAAYGAASHTCTLPIFLGIVLIPLAAGDYWLAGVAVALYGTAIAALLLIMASLGQGVLLAVRRAAGRYLQYATGMLFIFTAAFLFHYFAVNYGSSSKTAFPADAPVFHIIEGKPGSPYPYDPSTLRIPAGRVVAVELTDNLGGCGLVTVFPGLAVNGGDAKVTVPVGTTKRIYLKAPRPGRYRFHCAENMYFGTIIAE